MKTLHLPNDLVVLIDDEDFPLVNGLTWTSVAHDKRSYAVHSKWRRPGVARTTIYMHCLILDCYSGIDHMDGNGLNNQKWNLRPCTASQNGGNRKKQSGTSSRHKGVSWHNGKRKWRAHIQVEKKAIHLGWFTAEDDAAHAYNVAAISLFKEFARLNQV
jgi:hypothetical protein